MQTVTVGSIMERDAYSCSAQATLKDVTKILIDRGVSSLPVVDDDGHVVGFISDGDIMRAIAEHKTRSIFSGGAPTMLYYDDETIEQKVLSLKDRNVMELATRKVLCVTEKPERRTRSGYAGKEEVQKASRHRRAWPPCGRHSSFEHHALRLRSALPRQ